jgi:hypothetical protein
MSDFINNISQFIQEQFPAHYRDQVNVDPTAAQRAVIVDFLEAYYEWIESVNGETFIRNRQMFEFRDIDQTAEEFVKYFRNTFLKDLAYDTATDDRFVIKHIMDLYRSKGSPAAIKLLIRLLFNQSAEVYFPGKDILRASDSRWINPIYVEVIASERSVDFVGKSVFGSISGATAFVESVVTKRSNNRLINIIYLSDVVGTFVFGDIITDDGILAGAPKVIGSLSGINIVQNNIGGNAIGDLFEVRGDFGQGAIARVTEIFGQSGAVEFSIRDGGFGYTLTSDTQVFVSDLVVIANNDPEIFETNTQVVQQLEKIYLNASSSDDFTSIISVGDTVSALNATGNTVANATIMEIGNETLNNIITPFVIVQIDGDTTFLKNQTLTFTEDVQYGIGRTLQEGDDVILEIASANGSFVNGEIVYQREFLENTSNSISSTYISGEIVTANSSTLVLTNVFGTFNENLDVTGRTSGATADVATANVTFEGTSGVIDSKVANNQYIVIVETEFTGNNKVQGVESRVIAEIDSSETTEITLLDVSSEQANVVSVANVYFTGTVIGQNTVNIGITTTSASDFIFVANTSVLVSGNTEFTVTEITSGSGATFEIGTLENEEVIQLKSEKIIDTNIFGIQYKDIFINGSGSGIGFVDSVTVIDGGSGYSNSSTVTFNGGGYLNQDPLIPALATVTTDGSGVITSINITNIGEGYFTTPTITISDGTGANTEAVMTFGYGFPKEPLANSNTIISDALEDANVTIGTIATLTANRPGTDYTGRPFVRVVNPGIAAFRKQDQIANITISFGTFVTGETVTQANSDAKGIVTSANSTVLNLRNISFTEDFTASGEITGETSSAQAIINTISYDTSAEFMGENAVINNFVIESQGVVANVAIVNSGLGYVQNEPVTLVRDGITIPGTAVVSQQGIAEGYWKSTTSHLSSDKKLQDNDYWQEYSYDIQSPVNLNEYRDTILRTLHMSGTKLFGTVVKENTEQVTVDVTSTITQSNT